MPKCKNVRRPAYYTGKEPSPKGRGYCARGCTPGTVMAGRRAGTKWKVKRIRMKIKGRSGFRYINRWVCISGKGAMKKRGTKRKTRRTAKKKKPGRPRKPGRPKGRKRKKTATK